MQELNLKFVHSWPILKKERGPKRTSFRTNKKQLRGKRKDNVFLPFLGQFLVFMQANLCNLIVLDVVNRNKIGIRIFVLEFQFQFYDVARKIFRRWNQSAAADSVQVNECRLFWFEIEIDKKETFVLFVERIYLFIKRFGLSELKLRMLRHKFVYSFFVEAVRAENLVQRDGDQYRDGKTDEGYGSIHNNIFNE